MSCAKLQPTEASVPSSTQKTTLFLCSCALLSQKGAPHCMSSRVPGILLQGNRAKFAWISSSVPGAGPNSCYMFARCMVSPHRLGALADAARSISTLPHARPLGKFPCSRSHTRGLALVPRHWRGSRRKTRCSLPCGKIFSDR